MDSVFGPFLFDEGWRRKENIQLFNTDYAIDLCAQAYYEQDKLTSEQETSIDHLFTSKVELMELAESLLNEFAAKDASTRFVPRTIHIERDGGIALLLDDKEDLEDGVAVLLYPEKCVISQDDYL